MDLGQLWKASRQQNACFAYVKQAFYSSGEAFILARGRGEIRVEYEFLVIFTISLRFLQNL